MPVATTFQVISTNRGRWTVDIQRPVYDENAIGEKEITSWESLGTQRAVITPLNGREYYQANQIESTTTHRISMRYIDWLRPNMRLVREAWTIDVSWAVVGVTTGAAGAGAFKVAGNRLIDLTQVSGSQIEITGSTGNDGFYTLRVGSSHDSGADETTINVNEAVSDSTVDGNVEFGGEHGAATFNIVAIPGKRLSTDREMIVLVKQVLND